VFSLLCLLVWGGKVLAIERF